MAIAVTAVLLAIAAGAVAMATRVAKVPYTVALVLAGFSLGALHVSLGIRLSKELLYAVVLPGLLFEAAHHLKLAELRANARAIVALAVPGVVMAMGATAASLMVAEYLAPFAPGFAWGPALVFAALIAATDPIAVVALFKTLGAPRRLSVLIDAESLVNDGTAIVLFTLVLAGATGGETSVAAGALQFVKVVGMGVAIGGALGVGAAKLVARLDRTVPAIVVTVLVTVLLAYGAFLLAEQVHASGVIATVTAGVACGSGRAAPSADMKSDVGPFWSVISFGLNTLVFLLIGLEVPMRALAVAWWPVAVAFVAVTIGRAVVVFSVSALLHRTAERLPWRWGGVLVWGGLRGALSLVLALSLPEAFPFRETIVTMTFGVVLVSIVLQGVTTGPLLRAWKLVGTGDAC